MRFVQAVKGITAPSRYGFVAAPIQSAMRFTTCVDSTQEIRTIIILGTILPDMNSPLYVLILSAVVFLAPLSGYAQEAEHSRYVESIQVLVDQNANRTATSILLQSISMNDIMISGFLEQDIREHDRAVEVVFTNVDTCIPGVVDEDCIIINMIRVPDEKDIVTVQESAKLVGGSFIDDLNMAFGTDATLHSVFVHHDDTHADTLDLPGSVGTRNTVSVVYTMPRTDPIVMYDMISSRLLAPGISNGGGFAEAAQEMAHKPDAIVTFGIIPSGANTHMLLKVTTHQNHTWTDEIDPLALLGFDILHQSRYLDGFYPLNSLIRIAIVTSNTTSVIDTASPVLPSTQRNGNLIPDVIDGAGWVFDPASGPLIRGTYILGSDAYVSLGDTRITLGDTAGVSSDRTADTVQPDENYIVIVVIAIVGVAAAAFYMKGYRRGPKTKGPPQQRP